MNVASILYNPQIDLSAVELTMCIIFNSCLSSYFGMWSAGLHIPFKESHGKQNEILRPQSFLLKVRENFFREK